MGLCFLIQVQKWFYCGFYASLLCKDKNSITNVYLQTGMAERLRDSNYAGVMSKPSV